MIISVLAQSEVKQNDEANLKKLEQLRADIVKTSNEATLLFADMDNQLTELEVYVLHFFNQTNYGTESSFFYRKHMKKSKLSY